MTEKQLKLLSFIAQHRLSKGRGPTFEEMVNAIGVYDNKSLLNVIRALTTAGLLGKTEEKSRNLTLTDQGMKYFSDHIPKFGRGLYGIDQLRLFEPNTVWSKTSDVVTQRPSVSFNYGSGRFPNTGTQTNSIRGGSERGESEGKIEIRNTSVNLLPISLSENTGLIKDLGKVGYLGIVIPSYALAKLSDNTLIWFWILLFACLITRMILKKEDQS